MEEEKSEKRTLVVVIFLVVLVLGLAAGVGVYLYYNPLTEENVNEVKDTLEDNESENEFILLSDPVVVYEDKEAYDEWKANYYDYNIEITSEMGDFDLRTVVTKINDVESTIMYERENRILSIKLNNVEIYHDNGEGQLGQDLKLYNMDGYLVIIDKSVYDAMYMYDYKGNKITNISVVKGLNGENDFFLRKDGLRTQEVYDYQDYYPAIYDGEIVNHIYSNRIIDPEVTAMYCPSKEYLLIVEYVIRCTDEGFKYEEVERTCYKGQLSK